MTLNNDSYIKCNFHIQPQIIMKENTTFFAPMIYLEILAPAIEYYKSAFDAVELRRWTNDDGSVHVAEMSINGALFHMHEESARKNELSPQTVKATTIAIGLFVDDPHAVMNKALAAGGTQLDPVTDYDYGYRQGCLADPFGHHWLIEKRLNN